MKNFLFGPYSLSLQPTDKILAVSVLAVLVVGIVLMFVLRFKTLSPVNLKLLRRLKNLALTYGLVGVLWLGFRYENAAYLSWRFWIIILALAILVWLGRIFWYLLKGYKKDLAGWHRQEVKQKYLKGSRNT